MIRKKLKLGIRDILIIAGLIVIIALTIFLSLDKKDIYGGDLNVKINSMSLMTNLKDMEDDTKELNLVIPFDYDELYVINKTLSARQIKKYTNLNYNYFLNKNDDMVEIFTVKEGNVNSIIAGKVDDIHIEFCFNYEEEPTIYRVFKKDNAILNGMFGIDGIYQFTFE